MTIHMKLEHSSKLQTIVELNNVILLLRHFSNKLQGGTHQLLLELK